MPLPALRIALLLLCSGACALIYQTVWLRELRLIFGASTPASAAVLAIFMGGLGVGGLLLGRRVERHARPLGFYAALELLIAASTALTPLLLHVIRSLYIALGGSTRLGPGPGTLLRLLLSALVLSVPTLLMGGTLPAAARAALIQADTRRRSVAVLYGMNTLGAVLGAGLSTFYLLEHLGNRATLWLACLLNAGVAGIAFLIARSLPVPVIDSGLAEAAPQPASEAQPMSPLPPTGFVLGAAALVGFAFLLMELVWYRMLGPLLGGSSFTFGLILAVALFGIGIGGLCYSLFGATRPATLWGFALTCVLEAIGIAAPYALGDRVALLALALRALGVFGFVGQVCGWAVVAALVVLPAAIAAGVQFPLLIALLGRGSERVGQQVGRAYAFNTGGAILGSLLGGFWFMPHVSALGTWRLVGLLLALLGAAAALLSARYERQHRWAQRILPASGAVVALLLLLASGPTAVWRHGGIGSGRAELPEDSGSYNSLREWEHTTRRAISWEVDGVESSVGLSTAESLAFLVNGKSDGSTRADAATFLSGGLFGAVLHEQPRRALVIGLGTGITAGWLGAVPSMERVDVVEIEPAILQVADRSALVNHDVMHNPKVHIRVGDGREALLSDTQSYDLIVSQPSNPYRAGVASLFTQEYYQSARNRLASGGLFLQWLQAYEVDSQTVQTIYATLASVFPHIETWLTQPGDLLVVGSLAPIAYDVTRLRQRLATMPYKSAFQSILRMSSLEGLLGHYLFGNALAQTIAQAQGRRRNTDDRTEAEFAFARSAGGSSHLDLTALMELAHAQGQDLPALRGGAVALDEVVARRVSLFMLTESPAPMLQYLSDVQRQRAQLHRAYLHGDTELALQLALSDPHEPTDLLELPLLADLFVKGKDERAPAYIQRLRLQLPTEAEALQGLWHLQRREIPEAAAALEAAFRDFRRDPWAARMIMSRALWSVPELVGQDKVLAQRMYDALSAPFAISALNEVRLKALINAAAVLDYGPPCLGALEQVGPQSLWQERFLRWRLDCYEHTGQRELAKNAAADLRCFLEHEPQPLGRGLTK